MEPIYTAEATATGGREGRTTSSDGVLDLALAVPKEMGGPGGEKTNPEQLFAAGYSSCFHSALTLVARGQKQRIDGSSVTADVGIGPEGGGFGLEVELKVAIPGVDRETATALVEKAHEVCPYSKATRGNIDVNLTVTDPV